MTIDFTQQFLSFDGEPLTEFANRAGIPTEVPVTLARLACNALLGHVQGEQPADAEEHLMRFALANKIRDNKAAVLSAEQITTIKDRIAKCYNNSLLVGQAIALLDPNAAALIEKRGKPDKKAA